MNFCEQDTKKDSACLNLKKKKKKRTKQKHEFNTDAHTFLGGGQL